MPKLKKCCHEQLQQVKAFIEKQGAMYKNTRRWAVGLAMDLLVQDIEQEFECEWTESAQCQNIES